MTMRMTGLISGLDTESLITQMVSGHKTKVENAQKQQTKLKWKKEAWSSLNTKLYSFYTGAHHLESGIPLGKAGAIISSGLILPLNICVGLVVACTMYAFFALFRKGGF